MARYKGPAKSLTHPVRTLVDDETLTQLNACRARRGENQAEFVRAAILFFILTKCSDNSIDRTMQSVDMGVAA